MTADATGRRPSLEERRRLVAESLRVGNPGNNARDLPTQADPRHDCQIELAVDEIKPYEHNPRRSDNAKFDEIKESIRACGIRNPITVTRRPGEQHFIIEAGGNTRLSAIQALWAETRDPRYQKLTALFRPWRSESHVLTAHLIENEQRGEMTFWDKACGVAVLKAQLEAEKGHALTLRQLDDELRSIGMSVNTATLAHYLFATDRLRILGDADAGLSGLDVKTLQPRLNLLKRYAQMRGSLTETELYATVFEPAFKRCVDEYRQTQAFSAAAVCQTCEEALAEHFQESVTQLRTMLNKLVQPSSASLESTTAKTNGSPPIAPADSPPITDSYARQQTASVSTSNTTVASSTKPANTQDVSAHSRAEKVATLEPFTEQVRRFATLAGVADCLSLDATAPHGYLMQALSLSDMDSQSPCKRRAWGLLALISGQLRDGACMSVPQSTAEGHWGAHAEADLGECMQRSLLAIDHDFMGWLLDAHDKSAGAFCRIVAMVRASSAAFRVTTGPNPQSRTD
jgi:ParB family protein of integrating conjugative element (PFGI_1 class)